MSTRASGEKFRQNLKKLVCNESTDSEDSEDFNDKCRVCKSKYPQGHGFNVTCVEWFHLICLLENVILRMTLFVKTVVRIACVHYFLSNFYFSPNDSPSKTMKNVFYFIKKALFILKIFKFLYLCLSLFFSLSAIAFEVDARKVLKSMMSSTA